MKTILVPVDFSNITDQVITEAARLAGVADARLVLLHVTEPAVGLVDYGVVAVSVAQVVQAAIDAAQGRLDGLKDRIGALGLPVEAKVVPGLSTEEILAQASALAADYIVIGSHGHGAIYNALVGSTTNAVLKRATCPVLVVPAGIVKPAPTEVAATQSAGK